jgi:hypothetical protein
MKTLTTLLALVALAAVASSGSLAASGPLRDSVGLFACPNPSQEPIGKIYGNNRGMTLCNDGATATAILAGEKYPFSGGVCWRDKTKSVFVEIGTLLNYRKAGDPPGFDLVDTKSQFTTDTVEWGLTRNGKAISWGKYTVKLSITGYPDHPHGKFSGKEPKLVNGKLTYVPVSGWFNCKRVLNVPS